MTTADAAGLPARRELHPTRVGPQQPTSETDAQLLARRVAQVTRGAARAAVLGISDGLVTNLCLILAMAGADATAGAVRLAGFASLLAGALSMAAGEWVSVRSQVELYTGLLVEVKALVQRDPEMILDEVANRLEEAGFGRETAQMASTELPLDEPRFLRFTSTTVFGVDPDELGSPMTAALSSLALFAVGALVPLLPWLLGASGRGGALASLGLTAVTSAVVGTVVSRSSGRPAWAGALRQLLIVAASAAVTYGVGVAFDTVVV